MSLMMSFASAVGGRRLAGEEERPRRHFEVRVLAQPVVEHDDVQRVQQLPLVLVNALDLAVEDRVRIDADAGRLPSASPRNATWPRAWLAERVAEAARRRRAASASQLVKIGDPAVADRLGDCSRASAGLASSSQRRGVTPLVLLLKRSGNISARSRTVVVRSSSRMDRRDAVRAVRADDGEVGHADLAHRRLPRSGSRAGRGPRRPGSGAAPRRGSVG